MIIEMRKKEGTWSEDEFPFFKSHHKRILVDGVLHRWKITTKTGDKCIIELEELVEIFCKKMKKKMYEYEVADCWTVTRGATLEECQGCKLYAGN